MKGPSQAEQRAFYDQWNRDSRSGGYDDVDVKVRMRTDRALEFIEQLDLPRPARVLEVGCGTGWLSERLAAFGHVTGVDLSPGAIDIAKARGISDARFLAGDFLALDLSDEEPFDLVVCAETLFYVEDQQAFVDAMAAVMRPGGSLVCTMINAFVYERTEGVPPPAPGQIRSWLNRRGVLTLLRDRFIVQDWCSLDPLGRGGILRLVNSPRLNGWLHRLMQPSTLRAIKERAGFGSGFVFTCTLR